MQIGKGCWEAVVRHLGASGEGKIVGSGEVREGEEEAEEEGTRSNEQDRSARRFVLQLAAT